MDEIFLDVDSREEIGKGKVKALRGKGFIPAVIYSEGKHSQAVKVDSGQLLRLIHQQRIENVIINIKIKDDKKQKARPCLIKEIQYDPVHSNIVHVDFNQILLNKAIKVNVPVAVKGEAAGVKQDGGSLEYILWEIEVECLPTEIPKDIEIDISQLKIGAAIHVKDITAPTGAKILNDPNEIILHVSAPMKEEAPAEAVEGEEKKEPEVIKEKKEVPAEEQAKEEKEKK